MGGANVIEYIVGLVRVKIVALLLGPEGVGLTSIFTSAMAFLSTATSFGISRSGVRDIASLNANEQSLALAKTVKIIRYGCWLTGFLGAVITVYIVHNFSQQLFETDISFFLGIIFGVGVLITTVVAAEKCILQGVRRIGDIAKINIICAILNSTIAIIAYKFWGLNGIIPVLTACAVTSLLVAYYFSNKVELKATTLTINETVNGIKKLSSLGMVLVIGSLLSTGLDIAIRIIIVKTHGLDSAGIYHAAWALSGLFASFIFTAMGADFYPRLTAIIDDKTQAIRLVNEQTEIGILLVMPCIIGVMAFSEIIVKILYSELFIEASGLLVWFLIGVFGRVISWPMGVIQLAKGEKKWLLFSETFTVVIQLLLALSLIPMYGLIGGAIAFSITYMVFSIGMLFLCYLLIGFKWSNKVKTSLTFYLSLLVLNILLIDLLEPVFSMITGAVMALLSFIFSFKRIKRSLQSAS